MSLHKVLEVVLYNNHNNYSLESTLSNVITETITFVEVE